MSESQNPQEDGQTTSPLGSLNEDFKTAVVVSQEEGKMNGTATRWFGRGYGFIKPDDGSDDVFCHFSSIQDGNCLNQGDAVTYEVKFNEANGKYLAENVTGGSTEDRRGGGSRPQGGDQTETPSAQFTEDANAADAGGEGKKSGTALRWNRRGFGFIKPDDESEDVYCHFSSIQDGRCLREGNPVFYEVVLNEANGKYRAENVTGGSPEERRGGGSRQQGDHTPSPSLNLNKDSNAVDAGGEGKRSGTALRWNSRGFGFIKPDDGSEDVYCHFSSIQDGNCLCEGNAVVYEFRYNDVNGKYRAEDVTGGSTEERRGDGGYEN